MPGVKDKKKNKAGETKVGKKSLEKEYIVEEVLDKRYYKTH